VHGHTQPVAQVTCCVVVTNQSLALCHLPLVRFGVALQLRACLLQDCWNLISAAAITSSCTFARCARLCSVNTLQGILAACDGVVLCRGALGLSLVPEKTAPVVSVHTQSSQNGSDCGMQKCINHSESSRPCHGLWCDGPGVVCSSQLASFDVQSVPSCVIHGTHRSAGLYTHVTSAAKGCHSCLQHRWEACHRYSASFCLMQSSTASVIIFQTTR
jgi:hypothetical protein